MHEELLELLIYVSVLPTYINIYIVYIPISIYILQVFFGLGFFFCFLESVICVSVSSQWNSYSLFVEWFVLIKWFIRALYSASLFNWLKCAKELVCFNLLTGRNCLVFLLNKILQT